MNSLLVGSWQSNQIYTTTGRMYRSEELVVKIDSALAIQVTRHLRREWNVYPNKLEIVGNLIKEREIVWYIIKDIQQNKIELFNPSMRLIYHMDRLVVS